MSAFLDSMLGIINAELKGLVSTMPAALSARTLILVAWIISASDEVKGLFVLIIGKYSTGVVYAFTPINKPGFWVISPRRITGFTSRSFI